MNSSHGEQEERPRCGVSGASRRQEGRSGAHGEADARRAQRVGATRYPYSLGEGEEAQQLVMSKRYTYALRPKTAKIFSAPDAEGRHEPAKSSTKAERSAIAKKSARTRSKAKRKTR